MQFPVFSLVCWLPLEILLVLCSCYSDGEMVGAAGGCVSCLVHPKLYETNVVLVINIDILPCIKSLCILPQHKFRKGLLYIYVCMYV